MYESSHISGFTWHVTVLLKLTSEIINDGGFKITPPHKQHRHRCWLPENCIIAVYFIVHTHKTLEAIYTEIQSVWILTAVKKLSAKHVRDIKSKQDLVHSIHPFKFPSRKSPGMDQRCSEKVRSYLRDQWQDVIEITIDYITGRISIISMNFISVGMYFDNFNKCWSNQG